MRYKKMIEDARQKGVASEESMWKSVADMDAMLESMKDTHPEMYWDMMRKTHENLYGPHYDEDFAEYDISKMESTDNSGMRKKGAHWSKDEVKAATMGKPFPSGTTDCDKWVAYNAAWHDFHKNFDDGQILDIAYLFFFADEDWHGEGKIWDYMN